MSVTISNSPVHSTCIITYPYGVINSSYSCGWHTGIDFAPYGTTENNPLLFPVISGTVVATPVDNTLGTQVLIEDTNGNFWRYCHLVQNSVLVTVGQSVTTLTPIGRMGATGNVTGRHLHLEYSTTQNWNCNNFLNPATFLNIPNIDDTIINYDGSSPDPTPTEKTKNYKKWIFAKSKKISIKY